MVYGINIVSAPIYGNLPLTATIQQLVWWILVCLYSVCIDQVPCLAAHYLRYVNATGAVSFKQITIDSRALISSTCSSRHSTYNGTDRVFRPALNVYELLELICQRQIQTKEHQQSRE